MDKAGFSATRGQERWCQWQIYKKKIIWQSSFYGFNSGNWTSSLLSSHVRHFGLETVWYRSEPTPLGCLSLSVVSQILERWCQWGKYILCLLSKSKGRKRFCITGPGILLYSCSGSHVMWNLVYLQSWSGRDEAQIYFNLAPNQLPDHPLSFSCRLEVNIKLKCNFSGWLCCIQMVLAHFWRGLYSLIVLVLMSALSLF